MSSSRRIGPDIALARLRTLLDEVAPAQGDRAPPERTLAERVGCSRETIRSALRTLELEGEIWRQQGKGTFRGRASVGHPVRDSILVEATKPVDVMEARLLLEPPIAATAALRRTSEDLDLLRRRVEAGRKATDRSSCEQADDAFHRTVAQVARNPVLIAFLRYLSGARRRSDWQREWDRTYRRIGVAEFTGRHSDQHAAVVDAIAEGDERRAEQAMRRHLIEIAVAMRGVQGG